MILPMTYTPATIMSKPRASGDDPPKEEQMDEVMV